MRMISPLQRTAAVAVVAAHAAAAALSVRADVPAASRAQPRRRAEIVVVKPVQSCRPGETAYASSAANLAFRRLRGGGVVADMDDDRMLEQVLAGRKLAFLVMFRNPRPSQLGAVKRFISRGGKICSFCSDSPELASLMGVEAGGYRTPGPGGFGKIAFVSNELPGVPAAIGQSSGGVFAANPVPGKSRAIAQWTDASGRPSGIAAVLASRGGWWVTQVLPSGGDERGKALFMLSVAGTAVPGAWNAKAHFAAEAARRRQTEAFARRQSRKPGEIHAVWDRSGTGLYPGDWPCTMRLLAAHGITDVMVNAAGPGFAHYPSKILPASDTLRKHGDQLAQCLAAAKRHGIRVHAWVMCFNADKAQDAAMRSFAARKWLLRGKDGATGRYMDPSRSDLRAYLLSAISEIASGYPVAGVHLDFVRWYEGAAKPPDAAATIAGFVAASRRCVKTARPGAWLTAATLATYPSCVGSVGQDWISWIGSGIVDYAFPMNYAQNDSAYAALLARQSARPEIARRLVSGIGVSANESSLDAAAAIRQIAAARRAGFAGVALFSLDDNLASGILPFLSMGIF